MSDERLTPEQVREAIEVVRKYYHSPDEEAALELVLAAAEGYAAAQVNAERWRALQGHDVHHVPGEWTVVLDRCEVVEYKTLADAVDALIAQNAPATEPTSSADTWQSRARLGHS